VAQAAFRLFVRESFCGGVSQPLSIAGFSAVGQATGPKGRKAPAVLPAAAPVGLKMKDAITKRSHLQFGTWRGISRTVWPSA
jgi:hypothetical protein